MVRTTAGRGRLVATVAAAVVLLGALVALGIRGLNPTSAELGREGTRELTRAPDDLPDGIVPPGATDVLGSVARSGEGFIATVTFSTSGSLDELVEHVTAACEAEGWTLRQRAFDDTTRQAIFDGPGGDTLTLTAFDDGATRAGAVVLQGRRPADDEPA